MFRSRTFSSSSITSSALLRQVQRFQHFSDVCHLLWVTSQHLQMKWVSFRSASHQHVVTQLHLCRQFTFLLTILPTQLHTQHSPTWMRQLFSHVRSQSLVSTQLWIHLTQHLVSSIHATSVSATSRLQTALSRSCSVTRIFRTSSLSWVSMSSQKMTVFS